MSEPIYECFDVTGKKGKVRRVADKIHWTTGRAVTEVLSVQTVFRRFIPSFVRELLLDTFVYSNPMHRAEVCNYCHVLRGNNHHANCPAKLLED